MSAKAEARDEAAAAPPLDLAADVRFVPGIGPRRAELLASRGIRTVEDLVSHFPIRYEERGRRKNLADVREGEVASVTARVVQASLNRTRRRGFTIFQAILDDGTVPLRLVAFNQPYLVSKLVRGVTASFHGRIARGKRTGTLQLENPSFEILAAAGESPARAGEEEPGLVPVHAALPGFTPRGLRVVLRRALDALASEIPDTLPSGVAGRHGLVPRRQALRSVHFPPPVEETGPWHARSSEAHRRLAFEELFAMQAAFRLRRLRLGARPPGRAFRTSRELGDRLRALLPFRLTPGQRAAFREIAADLTGPVPMARLLQGDVGSGKTMIAFLAMLVVADNGFQAALMAPTEILAEQHAASLRALLGERAAVELLTGGSAARERRRVLGRLRSGAARLVVGTHALFQDDVAFAALGLVVVDEQHRFGVEQRQRLCAKGRAPDVLVMSATPIPRTLALTLHGDLDVTTIPDRPPGRPPVRTVVRVESARDAVLEFLDEELGHGGQAYVVHPSIDETEEQDRAAATVGAERLAAALPSRRVGLLHGRLPPAERDEVMRSFVLGRIDALVATTVIEVGVDVPRATVMLVEGAERFGLSQLHQLRGRVGRGVRPSWCILMQGAGATAEGRERLARIERTNDGFVLAEDDLALRGAGEFFGLRQAGPADLRVADPVRDRDLLLAAREAAFAWVDGLGEADLRAHPLVRSIEARWLPAVERSASG